MNILIIEDCKDKVEFLSYMLENNQETLNSKVVVKDSRNEALRFLRDETNEIHLIFLDWNFPIYSEEEVKLNMGRSILTELKRKEKYIPTILTSSDKVEDDLSSFTNIIGHFFPTDDMDKFDSLLKETRTYNESHQTFVFTFGEINPLFKHKYTKIVTNSSAEARRQMFEIVGDKWCFQYPIHKWLEWENSKQATYFPKEVYIPFEKVKEIMLKEKEA